MRNLLLVLLLVLVPTLAFAGEDELHGAWRIVAVRQGSTEVRLPPPVSGSMTFDKGKKSFEVVLEVDKQAHALGGTWSLRGATITFALERVDGQALPRSPDTSFEMTYAFEGPRLVLSTSGLAVVLERPPPAKP